MPFILSPAWEVGVTERRVDGYLIADAYAAEWIGSYPIQWQMKTTRNRTDSVTNEIDSISIFIQIFFFIKRRVFINFFISFIFFVISIRLAVRSNRINIFII